MVVVVTIMVMLGLMVMVVVVVVQLVGHSSRREERGRDRKR